MAPQLARCRPAAGEKSRMSRKTTISVLLLIAAAILAIALFIAGAIWRGRMSPKPTGAPALKGQRLSGVPAEASDETGLRLLRA
jgi:hypothetical protein